MKTVSPVLPGMGFESHEIRIAENQAEFNTVHALILENGQQLLFRFQLTEEDRHRVAEGQDLFMFMATFGKPMHPIILTFAKPEEIINYDTSIPDAANESVM